MGFLDKLKNVFFEEEEVEVDEQEEEREKVHVAKKIDTVEPKKQEEVKAEPNKLEIEKEEEEEKDFKFPMGFDDKDFEVEKTIEIFAPVKEKEKEVIEEPEVVSDEPPIELPVEEEYSYEEVSYEEPQRELYKKEVFETHHRLYEGKEKDDKQGFTPSPIISPIYGILNKNYKKEEIVDKNEKKAVDLSLKKDDLDIVREKAYGDLAGDITASIEDDVIDVKEEEKPKEKEDLLYDLSDEKSPTVKTVTVGDAEEYFNDLGLEYNVDYKVEKEEPQEEKPKHTRVEKLEEDEDDKNLFDLIDAMYEDEEKE